METQLKLDLDPAWEKTLSGTQKQQLQGKVSTLDHSIDLFHVICFHTNQKENGGFVLSLLLCNYLKQSLPLNQVKIDITNREKGVFINGEFTPHIVLKPRTVKPWSFIFEPEQTTIRNKHFTEGTITFQITSNENPILYHDTFTM